MSLFLSFGKQVDECNAEMRKKTFSKISKKLNLKFQILISVKLKVFHSTLLENVYGLYKKNKLLAIYFAV